LPGAIDDFERLVQRSLSVQRSPSRKELLPHAGRADWKDLPHLVSALEEDCRYLTTYNIEDYESGHPDLDVVQPGALVRRVREQLSTL
jgi:hypothetical protein